MARYRSIIAASVAAVALAAAGCDNEEEADNPGQDRDAPVNTDTPQADPSAPPPSDPEVRTTRTDGE